MFVFLIRGLLDPSQSTHTHTHYAILIVYIEHKMHSIPPLSCLTTGGGILSGLLFIPVCAHISGSAELTSNRIQKVYLFEKQMSAPVGAALQLYNTWSILLFRASVNVIVEKTVQNNCSQHFTCSSFTIIPTYISIQSKSYVSYNPHAFSLRSLARAAALQE